jgi:hypothetical protein
MLDSAVKTSHFRTSERGAESMPSEAAQVLAMRSCGEQRVHCCTPCSRPPRAEAGACRRHDLARGPATSSRSRGAPGECEQGLGRIEWGRLEGYWREILPRFGTSSLKQDPERFKRNFETLRRRAGE